MKTRMQKWKRYRRKIERTRDSKLPGDEIVEKTKDNQSSTDDVFGMDSKLEVNKKNKIDRQDTPYNDYKKKRLFIFSCKIMLLIIAIIGFTCLYVYWVR